jgi:hypothetical protein
VGLFDDIDVRPEELLLAVMDFLAVRSDRRYISREVRELVNPTAASKIPDRYRRFLDELLQDDLAALRERFGLSWSSQSAGLLDRQPTARDERLILALHQR